MYICVYTFETKHTSSKLANSGGVNQRLGNTGPTKMKRRRRDEKIKEERRRRINREHDKKLIYIRIHIYIYMYVICKGAFNGPSERPFLNDVHETWCDF